MWSAFDPATYGASHDFLQMMMWRNAFPGSQPPPPLQPPAIPASSISPAQVSQNIQQDDALQKQLCANSLLHQALALLAKKTELDVHSFPRPTDFATSGSNSPPSFQNLSTVDSPWLPPLSMPQNPIPPARSYPPTPVAVQPPIDLSTEKPQKYDKFSITDLLADVNDQRNSKPKSNGHCFECVHCSRSYSTKTGLQRHENQCNKDREGSGSPEIFQENSIEVSGLASSPSSNNRQYTCHVCTKIYFSMSALKMHIRTHTLPCKCHICGKAFSRMWLLNGHLRTHTGEKPFGCRVCQRAFADRSNLRAHMQTHSEVKRYRCDDCGKTFSRMGLLTRHTRAGCSFLSDQPVSSNSSPAAGDNGAPTTTAPEPLQHHQAWNINSVFS